MNERTAPMRTAGRPVAIARPRKAKEPAPALMPEPVKWIAICVVLAALAVYGLKGATRSQVSGEALDGGSTVFDGALSDGKFVGQGALTLESGDKYEGGFAAGRYDGSGRYVAKEGWTYDGTFQAGRITGAGTLQTQDGVIQTTAKADPDDQTAFSDGH